MARFIATAFLFIGIIVAVPFSVARAQTAGPQFLVTWHASGSYVPPGYPDKALPNRASRITASVEVLSGGKQVSLAGQTIYWYLDTNYIGGGTGAESITFSPDQPPPATLDLEVKLPSYNGQAYTHDVLIPLVSPVAVIYAPYPNGVFSAGQLDLKALPYFFYATSSDALTYAWSANGQPGTNVESPDEALVSLPPGAQSGTSVSVTLAVTDPVDSTVATAISNLTYNAL